MTLDDSESQPSVFSDLEAGSTLRFSREGWLRLLSFRVAEACLWLASGYGPTLLTMASLVSIVSLSGGATWAQARGGRAALRSVGVGGLRWGASLGLAMGPMVTALMLAPTRTAEAQVQLFLIAITLSLVSLPLAVGLAARTGPAPAFALAGSGPLDAFRKAWRTTGSRPLRTLVTQGVLLGTQLAAAVGVTSLMGVWGRAELLQAEVDELVRSEGQAFGAWRLLSLPVAVWAARVWRAVAERA